MLAIIILKTIDVGYHMTKYYRALNSMCPSDIFPGDNQNSTF